MESKIIGYRGIANAKQVIISGHAFQKHKIYEPSPSHNRIYNLRQAIRRFRLRPLKHASVQISIGDTIHQSVRTNKRGFFTSEFNNDHYQPGWHDYELKWSRNGHVFRGEFFRASEEGTGVISDIDDTVLVSHSTKALRKLSLVLFRNAYSRKPIPLIKHWQNHIHDLNEALHPDDFFYVSNSEWNLYDFLEDFFEINELPKGVFFLQELKKGLKDLVSSGKVSSTHKLDSIKFLMRFYPKKSYILIGDNGQKDMEIYSEISALYPERIKGVMIRKLPYKKNKTRMDTFEDHLARYKIPFLPFH